MAASSSATQPNIQKPWWRYEVFDAFRKAALSKQKDEETACIEEAGAREKLEQLGAGFVLPILVDGKIPKDLDKERRNVAKSLSVLWEEIQRFNRWNTDTGLEGEFDGGQFDYKKIVDTGLRMYWEKNDRNLWKGVNLGGWLLLEPGPAYPLFEVYGDAKDEYTLMSTENSYMDGQFGRDAIPGHRARHTTLDDFKKIKSYGFNSVRLPFGYWIITGPTNGDPYVGPDLQWIDKALAWAEETDLWVILDLHGCPGGQSNEEPCGHGKRGWKWTHWRRDESLDVIRKFCDRYKDNKRVVGIEVTNEPGSQIPCDVLCEYYENAIKIVREYFPPWKAAILLPIYQEHRLNEIWGHFDWHALWVKYDNIAFDIHYYHCFGGYNAKTSHDRHCYWTRKHGAECKSLPGCVVGEWSLSRPGSKSKNTDAALKHWAELQERQYMKGSHGAFFWNWRDYPSMPEWDLQQSINKGWVEIPTAARKQLSNNNFPAPMRRNNNLLPPVKEKSKASSSSSFSHVSSIPPSSEASKESSGSGVSENIKNNMMMRPPLPRNRQPLNIRSFFRPMAKIKLAPRSQTNTPVRFKKQVVDLSVSSSESDKSSGGRAAASSGYARYIRKESVPSVSPTESVQSGDKRPAIWLDSDPEDRSDSKTS